MDEPIGLEKVIDPIEKEDARIGYQASVEFWTYQGQLNWNRFNVMLVASSVIMAVIGAVFSGQRPLPFLTIPLAGVGLLLCGAWVLLTARGFEHSRYWSFCAQELEKHYFKDVIRTVSRLQTYQEGGEIEFRDIGKKRGFDKRLSRVSQEQVAYIVIGVFAFAFAISIVYDILVVVYNILVMMHVL